MMSTNTPRAGQRIVLQYPPGLGGPNCPEKSVGEVFKVEADGSFHVAVQPLGYVIRVVPEEYAAAGASWREWSRNDGWPTEKQKKPKKVK